MSIKKFPEYMNAIINIGGENSLGTFTIEADGEISNIYAMMIFYRTDLFTNEQIRIRGVRALFPGTPIYSEWVQPSIYISNFTNTNHWLGRVRFDFSREQIQESDTIEFFLETQNYTYAPNGTEIGSIYNYIDGSGQFSVVTTTAIYNEIFSYR